MTDNKGANLTLLLERATSVAGSGTSRHHKSTNKGWQRMAESTKADSLNSVSHLLMVWVIEVCRCSTGLLASLGREGTRVFSAGMLTLRRKA